MIVRLILRLLLIACVNVPGQVWASGKSVINATFSIVNGQQRLAYQTAIQDFERLHPNYTVNFRTEAAEVYKDKIEIWLSKKAHSDVMLWFGGERLNGFIERQWIRPISSMWASNNWGQRYTLSAQSAVKSRGEVFAIPLHYYHWGIYYKKSLFERLEIHPPESWAEFIEACERLKRSGIAPLSLGSKEFWPLAGWFDYLNLRINGLQVHQALNRGDLSYRDDSILAVFQQWKTLIDGQYFLEGHETLTWRDALPYLYRDLAGMMLMGNFWTSQIPPSMRSDFSVFRFPVIDASIPIYEEAPTDVMFIPSNVANLDGAKALLRYFSNPSVLNTLNNELGMLAPQTQAQPAEDHFLISGIGILAEAEGASQFYDRDNPKPIATEGMKLMREFMLSPDSIDEVTRGLEDLRKISFKASKTGTSVD